MATRRVRARGRSMIALVLVTLVLVASMIIWRRSVGNAEARAMDALRNERAALEARKAALERDVRDLTSRAVLAPIVERSLGLHVAHDSQQVFLRRPGGDGVAGRDGGDGETAAAGGSWRPDSAPEVVPPAMER